LLWAPFSEMKGRRLPFLISYLPFALFNLGGALAKNIETIIITRFFAGLFGSSMLTNAGGCIADVFSAKERGLATALFSLAPFLGPVM
jgi:MFS family permease